jgi:hypothetical protein
MIAALYVMEDGPYAGLDGVEVYGVSRDARLYEGPWPVVAHPPCERWGRYWYGGPMLHKLGRRLTLGDDGGCFAAALASARRWGGVIEHPAASHAWRAFGLATPPHRGGWIPADFHGGWTCHVEQGHWGHRARKATWLYAVRTDLPILTWGPSVSSVRMDAGFHSKEERRKAQRLGDLRSPRMPRRECALTPLPFRDLLLSIARTVVRSNP